MLSPIHHRLRTGAWRQDAALAAFVFALIFAFIWLRQHTIALAAPAFSAALVGALALGHARSAQSFREVGFRLDTAPAAARLLTPVALTIVAIAVLAGALLGSARSPDPARAAVSVSEAIVFGLAQQYVLLGFFYRRFERLLPGSLAPLLATATVFAVLHLPNPFLTFLTFFAGLISAMVYKRAPNLWVNGTVHGLTSFSLYYSLPLALTGGLRVGPAYWAL